MATGRNVLDEATKKKLFDRIKELHCEKLVNRLRTEAKKRNIKGFSVCAFDVSNPIDLARICSIIESVPEPTATE